MGTTRLNIWRSRLLAGMIALAMIGTTILLIWDVFLAQSSVEGVLRLDGTTQGWVNGQGEINVSVSFFDHMDHDEVYAYIWKDGAIAGAFLDQASSLGKSYAMTLQVTREKITLYWDGLPRAEIASSGGGRFAIGVSCETVIRGSRMVEKAEARHRISSGKDGIWISETPEYWIQRDGTWQKVTPDNFSIRVIR